MLVIAAAFSGCAGTGKTESEAVGTEYDEVTAETEEAEDASEVSSADEEMDVSETSGGEAEETATDAGEASAETGEMDSDAGEASAETGEKNPDAGEVSVENKDTEERTAGAEDEAAETGLDGNEDNGEEMTTERGFYAEEIPDDVFEMMQGKSYKADCPIPREDLRYIHVLHKTLEGETEEGVMVCHKVIAEDLLEIFKALYEQDYPIERMWLVDEYDAVDEYSMADNNSSCFNYRVISHTTTISKHGLGIAVDINPLYNPYTKMVNGERTVEPANGEPYLDREADFPYKIDENDLCYKLFIEHGFKWGGAWRSSKDYQHFELPDDRTEEIRALYK